MDHAGANIGRGRGSGRRDLSGTSLTLNIERCLLLGDYASFFVLEGSIDFKDHHKAKDDRKDDLGIEGMAPGVGVAIGHVVVNANECIDDRKPEAQEEDSGKEGEERSIDHVELFFPSERADIAYKNQKRQAKGYDCSPPLLFE